MCEYDRPTFLHTQTRVAPSGASFVMNSFALLADDVEDVDDLAPKPVEEPVVKPTPPPTKQTGSAATAAGGAAKKDARRDGARTGNYKGGARNAGRGSFKGDRRRERRDGQEANGSGDPDQMAPINEDGAPIVDGEENPPEPVDEGPADMSLDEYLAQRKGDARLELRKSGVGRKANEVGGKMAKLKKGDEEEVQETSIMSAVSLKEKVNERAVKDSTQTAVAHNAKNQEFFKNAPGHGNRSYRGRGGRGRGYGRGRDYRPRYESRRVNNVNVQSPNVDDPTAFPSLSA